MDEVKDVITREQTSSKEKGPCKFPGANGPKFIEEMWLPMENGFKFSKEKWFLWENGPMLPRENVFLNNLACYPQGTLAHMPREACMLGELEPICLRN